MAKLPDIHVYAHHEHKITFDRKFGCKVLKDGLFTVAVPEDLVQEFTAFYSQEESRDLQHGGTFQCKTHQDAMSICNKFGKWKVAATEERELFIFYRNTSQGQFFVTGNGMIEPNGEGAETGEWYRGVDRGAFNRGGTIAGVSASVVVRVKITARSGEVTYKYERPHEDELGDRGTELQRFQMDCKPSFYRKEDANYIPYTEKAAAFFLSQIRQTCQRAYDLSEFLNQDDDTLSSEIEADRVPMGLASNSI